VHLASLRLRDFRNYARFDGEFQPGFHILTGRNAQGKTNLLEAIYVLATLRSFRGVASAQMVRHGQKGWFIGAHVLARADHELKLYWSPRERSLTRDGNPVRRLADFLGVLRAVAFCAEDIQLVKGPASRRRRFLDLLLSQTEPHYLPLLQRYAQALRSRNALLRQPKPDEASLESFTAELVARGVEILQHRRRLLPAILPLVQAAHQRISGGCEEVSLNYQSTVKGDFLVELRQAWPRERAMKATLVGPHRDELDLRLDGKSAAQFGSEGQKRSVVTALKIAQAEFLSGHHGGPPILLIDDIMGELDVRRRSGFLPLLERVHQSDSQVFMTCTEENWPAELAVSPRRWKVEAGLISQA
jgi:DNA replication and repair protein RecF